MFSAVAYYFGCALAEARKVPIGLIQNAVGGAPAKAWTDRETLERKPEYREYLKVYAEAEEAFDRDEPQLIAEYEKKKAEWKLAAAKTAERGEAAPSEPAPPGDPRQSIRRPSGLYNGMLVPLMPYAIRGVIWYQGETDAGESEIYRTLFPGLIRAWRRAWGQGAFPFLYVQITSYFGVEGNRWNNPERTRARWPYLRDVQRKCLEKVKNVAMAVSIDVGHPTALHPPRKRPVGERLALAARARVYGERIVYSGPLYRAKKVKSGKVYVEFDHIGGGLTAKGGELKTFEVAGRDGKYLPATAHIEGKRVVVWSDKVPKPVHVRYAWDGYPECNLYNAEGLPASPFRTDNKPQPPLPPPEGAGQGI